MTVRDNISTMKQCAVEGCQTVSVYTSHGWCNKHYQRWKRWGDPLGQGTRRGPGKVTESCTIEGCDRPQTAKGWCRLHYNRNYYKGRLDLAPVTFSGGYSVTHARIRRLRGSAALQACADCSQPADEWSYVKGCPDEVIEGGRPFCREHLTTCYLARCRSCHRALDRVP